MSQISAIYTALATQGVSVGSVTPTVYSLASLPAKVETAITPCRLLLPMGNNPTGGEGFGFVAIGTPARVNWRVVDLLLWEASEQGMGLGAAAPDLITYCGAYLDKMRSFKGPTSQSHLVSVNCVPGMYEYPSGSGNWYRGVLCTLEIEEFIVG